MNKSFEFDGSDINQDDIECSISFGIYSDPVRKEIALNNIGIYNGMSEFVIFIEHTIAVLKGVFVEENERGNGYGYDLMGLFLDEVDELGIPAILEIDPSSEEWLVSFYQKLGFVKIKDTRFFDFSSTDRSDQIIMVREKH